MQANMHAHICLQAASHTFAYSHVCLYWGQGTGEKWTQIFSNSMFRYFTTLDIDHPNTCQLNKFLNELQIAAARRCPAPAWNGRRLCDCALPAGSISSFKMRSPRRAQKTIAQYHAHAISEQIVYCTKKLKYFWYLLIQTKFITWLNSTDPVLQGATGQPVNCVSKDIDHWLLEKKLKNGIW